MSNPNKTTRTILRWTHVVVGFLIGVFVYTPARDSETFVLLRQARVRRLSRRLRQNPRRGETDATETPEETHRDANIF